MLKHQKLYFSPTRLAKEKAFKMSSRSVNWYILYGRQFGNSYQSIMQLLFPSLNSSILKHSVGESNKFRKGNKTNRWTLQCRIVMFRISVNSWFSIYTNGYRNKYMCNAERERERFPSSSQRAWKQGLLNSSEHTQSSDLGFQILFSTERNPCSLEEWLIP